MAADAPGALTRYIGGSKEAESEFAGNLKALLKKEAEGGRRLTVGTLIGGVRTKNFPENPIAGQSVRVIFVCNVRLREFPTEPVIQDAFVSNQAQQLVTGSDADGTPVTCEISASGTVTIIGRAAYNGPQSAVDYYAVTDVAGVDMSFVFGLRLKNVSDLDASFLTDLNAYRVGQGLVAFTDADQYLEDPSIDFHGPTYYQAYIGLNDGGRFFSESLGLTCREVTTRRDLFRTDFTDAIAAGIDPWVDHEAALLLEGFSATDDPWTAHYTRTECS